MFGRRDTVETLKETPTLDPVEDPETIDDLTEAVEEIAVEEVRNPDKKAITTLQQVHSQLDDEDARRAYITDETVLQRINAARRQFNKWVGRKIRSKEMPTWVEAGPSKYDHDKAQEKSRYARESSNELDEKLDRVRAAANGARGRALESIGTSVAEVNAEEAASERESVRDRLESEMIVEFRNPRITIGRVVRVNKKTVTVEYERSHTEDPLTGEDLDPMVQTRVDLDSEWLTLLPGVETIEEAENHREENPEK